MKKKIVYQLEMTSSERGFTIWAVSKKDTRWILDASTILDDGSFSYAKDRCKETLGLRNQEIVFKGLIKRSKQSQNSKREEK